MLHQSILVHFGQNLAQDQQIQQSCHRSLSIWQLHENVASSDQAQQELSRDMLNFVVASIGVMRHHMLAIWYHLVGSQLPEFDMIDHTSM